LIFGRCVSDDDPRDGPELLRRVFGFPIGTLISASEA
jgi:hypothetical protein